MEFGLANEFSVELDGPADVTIDYDNLSITLNTATPEPSSLAAGDGSGGSGKLGTEKDEGVSSRRAAAFPPQGTVCLLRLCSQERRSRSACRSPAPGGSWQ